MGIRFAIPELPTVACATPAAVTTAKPAPVATTTASTIAISPSAIAAPRSATEVASTTVEDNGCHPPKIPSAKSTPASKSRSLAASLPSDDRHENDEEKE